MTMQDGNTVNVTKLIDDGPIRSFQIFVFVLCSLAAFLDGVDTQSIGIAAPLIAANLKLSTRRARPGVFRRLGGRHAWRADLRAARRQIRSQAHAGAGRLYLRHIHDSDGLRARLTNSS